VSLTTTGDTIPRSALGTKNRSPVRSTIRTTTGRLRGTSVSRSAVVNGRMARLATPPVARRSPSVRRDPARCATRLPR
jgi:hypothetical protein